LAQLLSVTKFKDLDDAIQIGNDTVYGLGAGVWFAQWHQHLSCGPRRYMPAECGRTAITSIRRARLFGGYKQSGFGRETHKIILDHYQQTKNLLVSYSPKALGFF